MKRIVLATLLTAGWCGAVNAQDLPPEIQVDRYMLEAQQSLADTTKWFGTQYADVVSALEKIEALNVEPPLDFYFFFGRLLLEGADRGKYSGAAKGLSMLKQYVLKGGKNAENYMDALGYIAKESKYRRYVLIHAAQTGDAETIKALIAAGADVNARDDDGKTLLFKAAGWDKRTAVNVLIELGANLNARDNVGETPLIDAAFKGRAEVAKALIAAGADVNARDDQSLTPLNWAAYEGRTKTVKVLIAAGADLNAKDTFGDTPLHSAALKGHAEAIKALIAAGADLNVKNNKGKRPRRLAIMYGRDDIARIFKVAGAKK